MSCNKISLVYYNDIPSEIMSGKKKILEFGTGTGISQMMSSHRTFFIENEDDYLGVDIRVLDRFHLPVVEGDIRTFKTDSLYDLVLALHVLEHIEICYWDDILDRLRNSLTDGGCLVIGLPYKESKHRGNTGHKVFNIKEDTISFYLEDAVITKFKNRIPFFEDGATFIWAFMRYVKRKILRYNLVREYDRMLVVYQHKASDSRQ